jgi:hypothetical protein
VVLNAAVTNGIDAAIAVLEAIAPIIAGAANGIATAATALQAAIVNVNKDIEKGNLLSKITFTQ